MADQDNTTQLIQELRHLSDAGCKGTAYNSECHLAGRAAIELERLTTIKIPDYKIDDFRPLMRLADQDYSTLKRPLYDWAETFTCDGVLFKKGNQTDFASTPISLNLFAPSVSMYVGPAAKHDKAANDALKNRSYREWKEASETFYIDLIRCKTNENRAKLMYSGVVANGYKHKMLGNLK